MDGEIVLTARRLSRRFGALVALRDVDLEVRRGEGVAVFGPNGAGKTTLARVLATSLRPSSGELSLLGRDPWRWDTEARRRLGFVGHNTLLYDDLTALENLTFFGRLYGLDGAEEAAEAWLEAAGLAGRADDPVRTLSRGMQQRVAIARALLHDPLFVVLDEPFTGLDRAGTELLRRRLSDVPRSARSFLLVTHDLSQGLELCGRWVILARGRLVAQGASLDTTVRGLEAAYEELTGTLETARDA